MNSRIKEQDGNVVHVNFSPEELSPDYLEEENNQLFQNFTSYTNKNNAVWNTTVVAILIIFMLFCLTILSVLLIAS